jgi:hypothetical protein
MLATSLSAHEPASLREHGPAGLGEDLVLSAPRGWVLWPAASRSFVLAAPRALHLDPAHQRTTIGAYERDGDQ